jgi:hypothetical protein
MHGKRLIKGPVHDTEELMQLTFAVETSQPSGATFRMALGLRMPLALVWAVAQFARLF